MRDRQARSVRDGRNDKVVLEIDDVALVFPACNRWAADRRLGHHWLAVLCANLIHALTSMRHSRRIAREGKSCGGGKRDSCHGISDEFLHRDVTPKYAVVSRTQPL